MPEIEVVINWQKLDNWNDVFELRDESEDSGIYMITGHHPVFGDDSLLYIGLAQDQTFSERFEQHRPWLNNEWDMDIYIGRVYSIADDPDYNDDLWDNVIADVEALLIYFHSPPYNCKFISQRPTPATNLRVLSTGDSGDLYPEVSHLGLARYDNEYPRLVDEE
jgi:hypothetical protein